MAGQTNTESEMSLRSILVKGTAGTSLLKLSAIGLSFMISLMLARILGASGYGAYAYAMTWLTLLSVVSVLGMETLLIRHIAVYQTQSAWGLMRGILRWTNIFVLAASLGIVILVNILLLFTGSDSPMLKTLRVALFALPFLSMTHLRQAAMQGLRKVVLGQMPEAIVQPLLFIALTGCAYLVFRGNVSATQVVWMNVAAIFFTFFIGARILQRSLPKTVADAVPVYKQRTWLNIAIPLLLMSGLSAIHAQASIILLGILGSEKLVGIYFVSYRLATMVTFILIAANTALAPIIARLYAEGDLERLQHVITKSVRILLLVSLPLALAFILEGHWFLLLFGPEFTQGRVALAILCLGQIVNIASGSVGFLLIMTGHERQAALGLAISVLANIVLNVTLIPVWGLKGAACATAISMLIWNVLLVVMVHKRLGIHPTVLGVIGRETV